MKSMPVYRPGLEMLEERRCLSTMYGLHLVAQTEENGMSGFWSSPSISDAGQVSFIGVSADDREGLFVANANAPPVNLAPEVPSNHGFWLSQIDNQGMVLALELDLEDDSFDILRVYNANSPGTSQTLVSAGSSQLHFLSAASLAPNDGTVFFVGGQESGHSLFLADVSQLGDTVVDLTPFALEFPHDWQGQPLAADDGKAVVVSGKREDRAIWLYEHDSLAWNLIADGSRFSDLGLAPGISADGRVVTFYGEDSQGPGIFASLAFPGTTRTVHRIAGTDLESGGFAGFDPSSRVGVNSTLAESHAFTVSYIATNVSGNPGVYTSLVQVAPESHEISVGNPSQVIQVGNMIEAAGRSITALSLADQVNNQGQVVFWAMSDEGGEFWEAIVRADPIVPIAEFPWQNPDDRLDVNADNVISPIDALLVINRLNNTGANALPEPSPQERPPPYVDVNGDNFLSPIDALLVINFLNQQATAASVAGEAFEQLPQALSKRQDGEGNAAGEANSAPSSHASHVHVPPPDPLQMWSGFPTRDTQQASQDRHPPPVSSRLDPSSLASGPERTVDHDVTRVARLSNANKRSVGSLDLEVRQLHELEDVLPEIAANISALYLALIEQ